MKFLLALLCFLPACKSATSPRVVNTKVDTAQITSAVVANDIKADEINTGSTTPEDVLSFSQTLIGTSYKYGSADPAEGFDCSGFITYVFNHFNISVPRSSVDFTNLKREVTINEAKPGDLILFTGTDSTVQEVGHMGIITANSRNNVNFIHSTSGKANGVTITELNDYYMSRFVKVVRVFAQNDLN